MAGNDDYTVCLLHFDGVNGSTRIIEDTYVQDMTKLVIQNLWKLKYGSNDTDNVIISIGGVGTWDVGSVLHPWAVESNGEIYFYYTGKDGSNNYKIGVALCSTLNFNGKGFSKYGGNPILTVDSVGSWDESHVFDPCVIYDHDEQIFKMWYRGVNSTGVACIGYATSLDGLSWTKYGSNPVLSPQSGWEGNKAIGLAAVIKESATNYKMLYAAWGVDPNISSSIGLATSSDGISWAKYGSNPVLSAIGSSWEQVSVFSPRTIRKVGSVYHLLYCGKPSGGSQFSQIGYAYSTDLISWTRGSLNPILSTSKGWEKGSTPPGENENPFMFDKDGILYIYYDCWYGSPAQIGCAIYNQKYHNWICNGDAAITTAQSKFGNSCVVFDGSGDYIQSSLLPAEFITLSDFTMDMWVKKNENNRLQIFCGQCATTGGQATHQLRFSADNTISVYYIDTLSVYHHITSITAITDFNWHHIAVVRNGNIISLYLDGISEGTPINLTGITLITSIYKFGFGRQGEYTTSTQDFNGYIDEFRFSTVARWTSNFAPPTDQYRGRQKPYSLGM